MGAGRGSADKQQHIYVAMRDLPCYAYPVRLCSCYPDARLSWRSNSDAGGRGWGQGGDQRMGNGSDSDDSGGGGGGHGRGRARRGARRGSSAPRYQTRPQLHSGFSDIHRLRTVAVMWHADEHLPNSLYGQSDEVRWQGRLLCLL